MIYIILKMVCITTICVVITDLSDFKEHLKGWIKYIISKGKMKDGNYNLKLIDCSFCQSFWCNIFYLIFIGKLSIPLICFTLILAFFTEVIKDALLLLKDVFLSWINKISEKL